MFLAFPPRVSPSASQQRNVFAEAVGPRQSSGHDWIVLSDSVNIWIADHEGHVRYRDPRKIHPRSVAFAGSSMTDRIAFTYLNLRRDGDIYLVDERVAVFYVAQEKRRLEYVLESSAPAYAIWPPKVRTHALTGR